MNIWKLHQLALKLYLLHATPLRTFQLYIYGNYLIHLFDSFPPTDNTFPEPFSACFFTTPAYNLQKVCHTVHPQLQRDNNSVPILCSISNNVTVIFQPYIFATHLTPNIALANHPQQKKLMFFVGFPIMPCPFNHTPVVDVPNYMSSQTNQIYYHFYIQNEILPFMSQIHYPSKNQFFKSCFPCEVRQHSQQTFNL